MKPKRKTALEKKIKRLAKMSEPYEKTIKKFRKKNILKSKFYPVNPHTKVIKCEPFDRAMDIDWKYKNKSLKKVYVGRKGEVIKRLLKKGFKLK